jgi:hypothetical protein
MKLVQSEDNEAISSKRTVCIKLVCAKYDTNYLPFEFTNIDVDGEEKS